MTSTKARISVTLTAIVALLIAFWWAPAPFSREKVQAPDVGATHNSAASVDKEDVVVPVQNANEAGAAREPLQARWYVFDVDTREEVEGAFVLEAVLEDGTLAFRASADQYIDTLGVLQSNAPRRIGLEREAVIEVALIDELPDAALRVSFDVVSLDESTLGGSSARAEAHSLALRARAASTAQELAEAATGVQGVHLLQGVSSFEGVALPHRVAQLRSGKYQVVLRDPPPELVPVAPAPYAVANATGQVLSDPTMSAIRPHAQPVSVGRGEVVRVLYQTTHLCGIVGSLVFPSRLAGIRTVLVRHRTNDPLERRVDVEAVNKARIPDFQFSDLLPGDKVVTATAVLEDATAFYGVAVQGLRGGEVRDVGVLKVGPNKLDITVEYRVPGRDSVPTELLHAFQAGTSISYQVPPFAETPIARTTVHPGASVRQSLMGVPSGMSYLIVDAPKLPDGWFYRDGGQQRAEVDVNGACSQVFEFSIVNSATNLPHVILELPSATNKSKIASAYARLFELGGSWDATVSVEEVDGAPVGVVAVRPATELVIGELRLADGEVYFYCVAPEDGLIARGTPIEGLPRRLCLDDEHAAAFSKRRRYSLEMQSPGSRDWAVLGSSVKFVASPGGAVCSEVIVLPTGWSVRCSEGSTQVEWRIDGSTVDIMPMAD